MADAFAEKFQAKAASTAVDDPWEGKTPLGAVVDLRSVARIASLPRERTDGMDAFTELRWITIDTQPGHDPI